MEFNRREGWPAGANNIAPRDRLPEGAVRDSVNLDPNVGGTFTLRARARQIYQGLDVRGMLELGDRLLVADGTSLVEIDTRTDTSRVLRSIAGDGAFAGDELNGELFFCTANECLRYDGQVVRRWGVLDPGAQPPVAVVGGGSLRAGAYKFAMTYIDERGVEGGTGAPAVITVVDAQGLDFTLPIPPAGHQVCLYVGAAESQSLYRQHRGAGGPLLLTSLRDDTALLQTAHYTAPQPGQLVCAHNSVLLIARGSVLEMTMPMRPHLASRMRHFYQFPATIDVLESSPAGICVCADKAYLISDPETSEPFQRVLLDMPAVPGSGFRLPDLRVGWMTAHGQAFVGPDGALSLPTRQTFVPELASQGASGVLEHNGNQLVVTTMRGVQAENSLAFDDFYDIEVVQP
ncbi:hypothetical protein ACIGFL_09260 [Pseudomonas sp. NPDC077649]|uniref:hypothetical protein n=1 Tax=Pseudomonas sp. NPDC077649 TaxID=3364423 RepID=UPI0037CC2B72